MTTNLKEQKYSFPIRINGAKLELCNKLIVKSRINLIRDWSFIGGSRIVLKQKVMRLVASPKKASPVNASCNPFSVIPLLLLTSWSKLIHVFL